jgi:hypothetical protein
VISGDTLHVFAVHAPSRRGGEQASRPYRLKVVERLLLSVDSVRTLSPQARIIIAGDFNDYSSDPTLQHARTTRSRGSVGNTQGRHGAKGTYRYHGLWGSLDHILCDASFCSATRRLPHPRRTLSAGARREIWWRETSTQLPRPTLSQWVQRPSAARRHIRFSSYPSGIESTISTINKYPTLNIRQCIFLTIHSCA